LLLRGVLVQLFHVGAHLRLHRRYWLPWFSVFLLLAQSARVHLVDLARSGLCAGGFLTVSSLSLSLSICVLESAGYFIVAVQRVVGQRLAAALCTLFFGLSVTLWV